MTIVGLTGGIGSGKSTVASMLVERGAVLVDGDAIVKELQQPGMPLLVAMVELFGNSILHPDGSLNRPAVAGQVFNDKEALEKLNAIVTPMLGAEYAARSKQARLASPSGVVIQDVPLLKERREGMDFVVVVDVPVEVAVERLMSQRHFSEADARARIANQITREERRLLADVVIDNSGDRDHLVAEVDRAWALIAECDTLSID